MKSCITSITSQKAVLPVSELFSYLKKKLPSCEVLLFNNLLFKVMWSNQHGVTGKIPADPMTVCQAFLDKSDNLTFYHMGNLVQIIKCHVVWLPKNLN